MDSSLKQRLIGAAVLAALAIVFLPMLLKGPDVKEPDAAEVPLAMPAAPDGQFETRELSLAAPEGDTPPGGVLGMTAPPAPDAAPTPTPVAPVSPDGSTPPPVAPTPTPATPEVATAPTPTPDKPATPVPPPAPTPAPLPPKPVPPATVAAGNYAVNIGTFANLDNANALVGRLRAAKLPVITDTVRVKGAAALRVRVGPYVDRAAAEAARLRAEGIAGAGSRVIALDGAPLADAAPKPAPLPPKPATPAPTPPAAPKPAPVPATVSSGFAVQLAAPAEEAAALGLRDRARAAGFVAFVQRVETAEGVRYRVRLGPAADRTAAESLREAASQKLGIAGNVVPHP